MPTHTDIEPARHGLLVDGVLMCWRCELETEPDTGYCPGCGAVTIPAGHDASRSPARATSSTSAIGRRGIRVDTLELDPLQSLNALDLESTVGLRGLS
jgi:hypothetical protein